MWEIHLFAKLKLNCWFFFPVALSMTNIRESEFYMNHNCIHAISQTPGLWFKCSSALIFLLCLVVRHASCSITSLLCSSGEQTCYNSLLHEASLCAWKTGSQVIYLVVLRFISPLASPYHSPITQLFSLHVSLVLNGKVFIKSVFSSLLNWVLFLAQSIKKMT